MKNAFKEILDQIAATPSIAPPENFTENVMRHILHDQPGLVERFRQILLRPDGSMFAPRGFLSPASTRGECAFYYIIAGTFYLVLGLVLMVGLRGGNGEITLTPWSRIQPQLMIAAAFWLFGLGGILFLSGRTKMEVAKIATVIYILLVFLSGAVMITLYRMPVLMASSALFVISGVILGILLYQNISIFQKSLHH